MKIAVIGAGIIGVTTAYELACDGHDVTVFERRSAVAEETSFANAGIVEDWSAFVDLRPGLDVEVVSGLPPGHVSRQSCPDAAAGLLQP